MSSTGRLKDKVAILTGAARGIGRAYALRFAKEGSKVVIADILFDKAQEVAKEIKKIGGKAIAIKTDVSNEKSVNEMVKKTVTKFGRVDILVNNAALMHGLEKPFHQITVDEWDKVMAINARGPFLCAKAVFPHMKKQGKGKIINVASGTFLAGSENLVSYVASKGAAVGITRALARELGQYGINVNILAPGYTLTEIFEKERREMYDATIKAFLAGRCIKRDERPEDLTGAMVFLASDDSDFMTGQLVNVDGGKTMH